MAEDLKELDIVTPLKECIEYKTPYINVEKYRKVKVTTHSDVLLQVNIEFSDDGVNLGVGNMYRIASDTWKCEEHIVQMSFMRIRIVNQSGKTNENLYVKIVPVKYNEIYVDRVSARGSMISSSKSVALELAAAAAEFVAEKNENPLSIPLHPATPLPPIPVQAAPPVRTDTPEKKSKRFQSPFSRKKRDSKSKSNMTDFRLPTTIPEGALLYGGKLGEVKILPKGEPGDVLIINEDGFFSWRKIFVPDRKLTPPSRLPPPLCTPGTNIPSSPSITFNLDKIELAE